MPKLEFDETVCADYSHDIGEPSERMREVVERTRIMPNDVVYHKPTSETWVVCGVNRDNETLIPCGYPFPSIARIMDCELVERRYEIDAQSEGYIKALQKHGLTSYVDARSAMLHGII